MKKITLLLSLMLSTLSFSQIVTNGNFQTGAAAPWYGNAANVVDLGGSNFVNQAQVLAAGNAYDVNLSQIVNLTSGLTYQLSYVAYTDLVTSTRTMIVGLGQSGPPYTASTATTTLTSTPQTFTHQFTITYGEAVTDRVIFDMGAATGFVFIDDVVVVAVINTCSNGVQDGTETGVDCGGSCPPCVAAPTTAAPIPPNRPAADVKSIFSDAYTPIVANLNYAGVDGQPTNDNTFNTSWCGASTTLVQIVGNNTNKITGLGCEGISFLAGRFNAAGFTNFHIDIWTPTPTLNKSFNFKFSNWSGSAGESNAFQYSATNANVLTNPNPGWISIDLPLTAFTCINTPPLNNCPNNSDFVQFVITSDLGTVYYDNLYLHKNTVLGLSSFAATEVKMYPNPASDRLTIESTIEMQTIEVSNLLGQEIMRVSPAATVATIDISSLQSGVYFVKTVADGLTLTKRFIKK